MNLCELSQYNQGLIDPRSGERACNYAYACRAGEVLVVTKNRTLPFSKACPNPLKNDLLLFNITHQRTREFLQLEGQCRLHSYLCHPPTHLVPFLVTTSILPSLQAYAELHALFPLRGSITLDTIYDNTCSHITCLWDFPALILGTGKNYNRK